MKHIQDHIDNPTEIFTDLFVSLTGENATAVDAGGVSTQILDTFSNAVCHNFYLNKIKHVANQMVVSSF